MDADAIVMADEQHFETLIQGLLELQAGSCDNFFSAETLAGLRARLLGHYENGEMSVAGVGRRLDYTLSTEVRGDVIRWIDPGAEDRHERAFLNKIEHFIRYLNATCYTGINSYEFHYAYYAPGSFYKRHLDRFRSDKGREFSFVLYLNEDWQPEHGGKLSLYLAHEELSLYPVEGRVVFFRSDRTEHEVHPAMGRPRLSIAGWLKRI